MQRSKLFDVSMKLVVSSSIMLTGFMMYTTIEQSRFLTIRRLERERLMKEQQQQLLNNDEDKKKQKNF